MQGGNTIKKSEAKALFGISEISHVIKRLRKVHKIPDIQFSRDGYYIGAPLPSADSEPVFGSIWNIFEMKAFNSLPAKDFHLYRLELIIYGKRCFDYGHVRKQAVREAIKDMKNTFNPGAPYYVRITHIDYKEQKKAA